MRYPYLRTKVSGRGIDRHRLLMQEAIGRPLGRFELVHHVNGDKNDNRLENLKLVSPKQHAIEHGMWKHPAAKRCVQCGRIFTPHPTKRKRALTCSSACRYVWLSIRLRNPNGPRSKYRVGAYPSEVASRRLRQSSFGRSSK